MRRSATLRACLVALVIVLLAAPVAMAQVTGLYYQEVEKDDRIYVFNTPEKYKSWQDSGDMGTASPWSPAARTARRSWPRTRRR